MFGSVVAWFYNGLGGIKTDPGSPGMQQFIIEPKTVTDLDYCKASYNSLYGKIRSEWKKVESGKHQFVIEVPANTTATFILPNGNGKVTSDSRKDLPVKEFQGKRALEFGSGVYRFEA